LKNRDVPEKWCLGKSIKQILQNPNVHLALLRSVLLVDVGSEEQVRGFAEMTELRFNIVWVQ
jgi:hypothetical protein